MIKAWHITIILRVIKNVIFLFPFQKILGVERALAG